MKKGDINSERMDEIRDRIATIRKMPVIPTLGEWKKHPSWDGLNCWYRDTDNDHYAVPRSYVIQVYTSDMDPGRVNWSVHAPWLRLGESGIGDYIMTGDRDVSVVFDEAKAAAEAAWEECIAANTWPDPAADVVDEFNRHTEADIDYLMGEVGRITFADRSERCSHRLEHGEQRVGMLLLDTDASDKPDRENAVVVLTKPADAEGSDGRHPRCEVRNIETGEVYMAPRTRLSVLYVRIGIN